MVVYPLLAQGGLTPTRGGKNNNNRSFQVATTVGKTPTSGVLDSSWSLFSWPDGLIDRQTKSQINLFHPFGWVKNPWSKFGERGFGTLVT